MKIKASVVLSSDRTPTIADDLRQLGWQIECCSRPNDCEVAAARSGARAALIHTSGLDLSSLQASIEKSNLRWVALIDPVNRNDDSLRRLILEECSDYLLSPLEPRIVANILEQLSASRRLASRRSGSERGGIAARLLGGCKAMVELHAEIQQAGLIDAPALICGETGTGKELVARAIHDCSQRAGMPFVAINCGGTSSRLFLSELFGYEKGVFAGEGRRKLGKVELAAGGTLFLDEIGDRPPESDAALLRFLDDGTFTRLGGEETLTSDVRVISATNFGFQKAIRKSESGVDLFHRSFKMRINVPPLRDRGEDVGRIATYILSQLTADIPGVPRGFSLDAIWAMRLYDWPGNVRELINRVRRGVMMATDSLVWARDMDLSERVPKLQDFLSLHEVRVAAEREAVQRALVRHRYDYSKAARELGISQDTLFRMIQTFGLTDSARAT
ncbi:sigma-54 dependent transcriptional regulator [Paraburkholderia sediminicola]|uniref:sigma-54 dependent transcriptional regulator n=1 Tax=Paraburkholderia sediminicola TaxID=458836 RepID=UPI0038BBDB18